MSRPSTPHESGDAPSRLRFLADCSVDPVGERSSDGGRGVSLVLGRADVQRLQAQAGCAFPRECCGLLVGQWRSGVACVVGVRPARNIATGDPTRCYQIDWDVLLACHREAHRGGPAVLGSYHSHPDGTSRPSREDLRLALPDHVYVIVPVTAEGDGSEAPRLPGVPTAWMFEPGRRRFHPVPIGMASLG